MARKAVRGTCLFPTKWSFTITCDQGDGTGVRQHQGHAHQSFPLTVVCNRCRRSPLYLNARDLYESRCNLFGDPGRPDDGPFARLLREQRRGERAPTQQPRWVMRMIVPGSGELSREATEVKNTPTYTGAMQEYALERVLCRQGNLESSNVFNPEMSEQWGGRLYDQRRSPAEPRRPSGDSGYYGSDYASPLELANMSPAPQGMFPPLPDAPAPEMGTASTSSELATAQMPLVDEDIFGPLPVASGPDMDMASSSSSGAMPQMNGVAMDPPSGFAATYQQVMSMAAASPAVPGIAVPPPLATGAFEDLNAFIDPAVFLV